MLLNAGDPVEDCTHFARRGEMDLDDMKAIAWKIEPAKEFDIGFHPPKEKKGE